MGQIKNTYPASQIKINLFQWNSNFNGIQIFSRIQIFNGIQIFSRIQNRTNKKYLSYKLSTLIKNLMSANAPRFLMSVEGERIFLSLSENPRRI